MKGFIFDLDGVIVDTAKYHFIAWKKIANELDFDFTTVQNEQLKGVSREASLRQILSWAGKEISNTNFQTMMDKKNNYYLEYLNKMTKNEILEGTTETLNYLISKKQKIALGSASKNAVLILEKIGLIDKFDAIIDGTKVSISKPNPEVFLTAAKHLEIKPENCIVFEDAISGIQAANTANMYSIGIGDTKVLQEANQVFSSLNEIKTSFLDTLIKL